MTVAKGAEQPTACMQNIGDIRVDPEGALQRRNHRERSHRRLCTERRTIGAFPKVAARIRKCRNCIVQTEHFPHTAPRSAAWRSKFRCGRGDRKNQTMMEL